MTTRLGFVGLGVMGASMVRRLLEHGWPVTVTDVRPEAAEALVGLGATAVGTAAEVGAAAEVVLVSLPSPAALQQVALGADGLVHGERVRAVVDLSTTGPVVAREVAARLGEAAIEVLDCPVSGGAKGAVDGTLTLMAAGRRELFDELDPYLAAIGTKRFYVGGEPGQGQLAKVANNILGATSIAIVAEVLSLGVKGGLEAETLLEVINASTGRNGVTEGMYPRIVLPRTFDAGFRLALEVKDVGLCLEEANHQHVPMVVGGAVQQLWNIAGATAEEGADFTTIAKLVEGWAGVTLASRQAAGLAPSRPAG